MDARAARSRASSTRCCPRMTGLDKPFKLSANARLRARRTRKGKTEMAQQRLSIIMNGVTGRMGTNQHLVRSILAIRAQGGVKLKNGDSVMPDPILLGRDEAKLAQLAKAHGIARWTTDLNAALKNREDTLFFDAATTKLRVKLMRRAITAGKDIYCEKPVAETRADPLEVARAAKAAGPQPRAV